jgi:hypothetical protein
MANKVYLEWEKVTQNWENVFQVWEEVILIEQVARLVGSSGGLGEFVKQNPWKPLREKFGVEKTRKFIKIFAIVNDLDFDEELEYNEDIRVTVKQMKKVFEQIEPMGVKITFEN